MLDGFFSLALVFLLLIVGMRLLAAAIAVIAAIAGFLWSSPMHWRAWLFLIWALLMALGLLYWAQ